MNIYAKTLTMSFVALVTYSMQAGNTALKREKAIQRAKKGLALFKEDKKEDAVRKFKLALAMPELPNKYRGKILYKLGRHFETTCPSRRAKALKCYQDVLAIPELPDGLYYAKASYKLGRYYDYNDDDKAFVYFQQALKHYQAILVQLKLSPKKRNEIFVRITECYEHTAQTVEALEYFQAVLAQAELSDWERSTILFIMAYIYDGTRHKREAINKQKALECYQSILSLTDDLPICNYECANRGIAQIYLYGDKYVKADWKRSFEYFGKYCIDNTWVFSKANALFYMCNSLIGGTRFYTEGFNEIIAKFADKEMELADIEYAVNYIIENFTKPIDKNA